MRTKRKCALEYLIVLLVLAIIIISAGTILYFKSFERADFRLGVNFSNAYAEYLGLDWQKTYLAILDELKVKNIRIAAPWNEIETKKDNWDFSRLDWQVAEAEKRGVALTVVIGRRTPHWPECHDPEWIQGLPEEYVVERQLKMMEKIITRYKNNKSIEIWQVENEPLLDLFGVCPQGDIGLLRREVSMVKTMDTRPVLITDSGELSLWLLAANTGDLFGTTMYRVTYNSILGYSFYHLPPAFYTIKAWLAGRAVKDVFVSELQAEPWSPAGILNTSLEEQRLSMDAERLINHVRYARRTGFGGAYLWGAEWWYWLKQNNNDESLWQAGEKIFKNL